MVGLTIPGKPELVLGPYTLIPFFHGWMPTLSRVGRANESRKLSTT
jgi:hypothetical protein